eukprot:2137355-Pyramimonas_sp.AAC.1
MEPEKLLSGGLGDQKSIQLLVPEGHTMKSVAGFKQLDFFIASSDLAKTVSSVQAIRDTNL